MNPGLPLVAAVDLSLADEKFRDDIRAMHADGRSLVEMVEALGLAKHLTAPIRKILEDLPDDVVEGIRRATLEMLDGKDFKMPLDCRVSDDEVAAGAKVDVEVPAETIVIRKA